MTGFQKKKVLIIDDSPEDVILFKRYLANSRYYNYTFEVCDNATSALRSLLSEDPGCVILDYRLTGSDDGLTLLRKLKNKKFSRVPLIFATAYPSDEVIEECLDLGASYFIDKSKLSDDVLNKAVYYAINNIYDASFTEARSFA